MIPVNCGRKANHCMCKCFAEWFVIIYITWIVKEKCLFSLWLHSLNSMWPLRAKARWVWNPTGKRAAMVGPTSLWNLVQSSVPTLWLRRTNPHHNTLFRYVKSELFLDKCIQFENFKLGLLFDFFQMYVWKHNLTYIIYNVSVRKSCLAKSWSWSYWDPKIWFDLELQL